jgi:hypothetical protein
MCKTTSPIPRAASTWARASRSCRLQTARSSGHLRRVPWSSTPRTGIPPDAALPVGRGRLARALHPTHLGCPAAPGPADRRRGRPQGAGRRGRLLGLHGPRSHHRAGGRDGAGGVAAAPRRPPGRGGGAGDRLLREGDGAGCRAARVRYGRGRRAGAGRGSAAGRWRAGAGGDARRWGACRAAGIADRGQDVARPRLGRRSAHPGQATTSLSDPSHARNPHLRAILNANSSRSGQFST